MRRLFILIVVVMGLLDSGPLAAQTPATTPSSSPTATRTPPPIQIDYRTEIAFPHQIFFQADIKLAVSEIETVTLIIETINGERVEVVYPEEPFLFASDEVIAAYVWDIPEDNPPPLFQPLRYTWRIRRTNGQTIEEVQTMDFTDERVSWKTTAARNNTVTLVAPENVSRNVGALQVELTETLNLLQQKTGQTPQVRLLIYDTPVPAGCSLDANGDPVYQAFTREGVREEQPCDPAQAEAIYEKSGYGLVQLGQDRNLILSLTSPLVRQVYETLWAGKAVPLWFESGLEQFYQRLPNREALFTSRTALRGDTPFTLQQMNESPSLDESIIWNAQAYGMVLYLASRAGVDDVFSLARDLAEAESFEEAFTARMGFGTSGLIRAWQTWVFKQEAENAYLYTPYLATTPTPTITPTNTETPVPPTPTITLTPTIELSPTLRPTSTRRPPTRTPTPLPAQGFDLRPTAVPPTPINNSPLAVITRGNNPLIIGGGVLAILLVIVVSLLTGRRQR